MQHRSRLETAYDILLYIYSEKEGAKPTHILYKANLSPKLQERYLNSMIDDGLISATNFGSQKRFSITKRGVKFIKLLMQLDEMTTIITLTKKERPDTFND